MRSVRVWLAAVVCVTACSPCRDRKVREVRSPDGQSIVSVVVHECGPGQPPSTQVRLRPQWLGKDEVVVAMKRERDVELIWTPPRHLVVRCRSCVAEDIADAKDVWHDVAIQFLLGGL